MIMVPAGLVVAQQFNVSGLYNIEGSNPNGTRYRGTVTVKKTGDTYIFNWKVGTAYSGKGKLEGDIMTANWGDKYPVIYKVEDGGNRLVGKWANGAASETLYKQ